MRVGLLLALPLALLSGWARGQTVDRLSYSVSSFGATLTGYDAGLAGEVVLNSTVELNGTPQPLIGVADGALAAADITTVTLPARLHLGYGTLDDCTRLKTVYVVGTTTPSYIDQLPPTADVYLRNGDQVPPLRLTLEGLRYELVPGGVEVLGYLGNAPSHTPVVGDKVTLDDGTDLTIVSIAEGALEVPEPPSITPTVTVDGVEYGKYNGKWSVTGHTTLPADGAVSVASSVEVEGTPTPITSVAYRAYYNCSDLKRLQLPGSITTLGTWAFGNCTSLAEVELPGTLSVSLNTNDNKSAFYKCTSLSRVIIDGETPPSWLSTVALGIEVTLRTAAGDVALHNVEIGGLTYSHTGAGLAVVGYTGAAPSGTLVVPEKALLGGVEYTVKSVAANAFANCSGLTDVVLPATLTSVANTSFSGCGSLAQVFVTGPKTPTFSLDNLGTGPDVFLITDLDTREGRWLRKNVNGLRYDVKTNEAYVIGHVGDPATFTVPSSIEINGTTLPVTRIGNAAFKGCAQPTSLTLGDGLNFVNAQAFANCLGLRQVTIPASLGYLGSGVFNGTALSTIDIVGEAPPSWLELLPTDCDINLVTASGTQPLRHVVDGLVYDLTSLDAVTLRGYSGNKPTGALTVPEHVNLGGVDYPVVALADNAFAGCSGVTAVTLPASVKASTGSKWPFSGCTAIAEATLVGDTPPAWWGQFAQNTDVGMLDAEGLHSPLRVTYNGLRYEATEGGLAVVGHVTEPQGLLVIPPTVPFHGEEYPVVGIGQGAISYCYELEALRLPASVVNVETGALDGCSKLHWLQLPADGVNLLTDDGPFAYSNVEYVDILGAEIPEWVGDIGSTYTDVVGSAMPLRFGVGNELYSARDDGTVSLVGTRRRPVGTVDVGGSITVGGTDYSLTAVAAGAIDASQVDEVRLTASLQAVAEGAIVGSVEKIVIVGDAAPAWASMLPTRCEKVLLTSSGVEEPLQYSDDGWWWRLHEGQAELVGWSSPEPPAGTVTLPRTLTHNGDVLDVVAVGRGTLTDAEATAVVVDGNLTAVAPEAFTGCSTLTTIKIAASTWPEWADHMPKTVGLELVDVDDGAVLETRQFVSEGLCYRREGTTATLIGLNAVPADGAVSLPATVMRNESRYKIVGADLSGNSAVQTLSVAVGVDALGSRSFANCTNLTAVTLPLGCDVASDAFAGCTGLRSVTIQGGTAADRPRYERLFGSGVELTLTAEVPPPPPAEEDAGEDTPDTGGVLRVHKKQATGGNTPQYYDLQGRRLSVPGRGLCIVVDGEGRAALRVNLKR